MRENFTCGDFIDVVIRDGVAGARADYAKPSQKMMLRGSLRGFGECRGKGPKEMMGLLEEALEKAQEKFEEQAEDYWYWRCRASEIEWVVDVLGAATGSGKSARALLKAAEVMAKLNGQLSVKE